MKKRIKCMMSFFLIGIISLLFPADTRAEKIFSQELTELFGFGEAQCYVCGEATEDGVVQLKANATSVENGNIVEVQVFYYNSKAEHPSLSQMELEMFYSTEVLEYVDYTVSTQYGIGAFDFKEDYYAEDTVDPYKIDYMRLVCGNYYKGDGMIASFRYKVKKNVESINICCMPIAVVMSNGGPAVTKYYDEDGKNTADILSLDIAASPKASSTLTLSSAPAQGSTEVTIPINIETNDGFNLLGLTLDYDTSLFTYESLEIDDGLKSKISLDSIYEAPGSGKIKASFIALEDITETGDFLKLKLKIKDNVPAGTNSNVNVEITQAGNKAETDISKTGTTCAVSITGTSSGEEQQTLGDVNADKKIDLVDAVYILQNYNQVREFTKAQETAADVTKDGTVNLLDALMIMKYFNGEISEF